MGIMRRFRDQFAPVKTPTKELPPIPPESIVEVTSREDERDRFRRARRDKCNGKYLFKNRALLVKWPLSVWEVECTDCKNKRSLVYLFPIKKRGCEGGGLLHKILFVIFG